MSNIVTLTAVLLIAACLISIVILGKVADCYRRERNGWMNGFTYLHEHPGDLEGAFRAVTETNHESLQFVKASGSFLEKMRRV